MTSKSAPALAKSLKIAPRLFNHQMDIEKRSHFLRIDFISGAPECNVGHKVAVHYIQIGARLRRPVPSAANSSQGGKNRLTKGKEKGQQRSLGTPFRCCKNISHSSQLVPDHLDKIGFAVSGSSGFSSSSRSAWRLQSSCPFRVTDTGFYAKWPPAPSV